MSLRKIFCPECGQETQVNDEKTFCFCLQCGNKIVLHSEQEKPEKKEIDDEYNNKKSEEIEKKLEEVAFYYQLSLDKGEDANYSEEPVYYLKAQDILVDLSQIYPEDYRIWWEMCKPIDFNNATSGKDIYGNYRINEDFFSRALDRADINEKRRLISEHDRYIEEKSTAKEKIEEKRKEEERQHKEEEIARLKLEKQQQEEMQRKKIEEQQKQIELQKEKEKLAAEVSKPLWQALANKEYDAIDNSFFNLPIDNNQKIIGVFKNVSNVMYLIAFREDGNKGNALFRDQTLSIKFDENGHGLKFDNKPVRIKGMLSQQSVLSISYSGMNSLTVNGLKLFHDPEYVESIMKNAKKTLLSYSKYFY